jgi:2-phosphosulfolactate phosphatase
MNPDFLLFGEREGIIQPGFDYGNSPFHASKLNLQDKSAVHASSSGTPGLIAALDSADQVITASFVNAAAVARYIKTQNPKTVTLVDMGWAGRKETLEDKICACYIFSLLSGEEFRFPDYIYQIYQTDGKRFFLPENQPSMPPEDFFFCLRLNIFDFILKADLDKFDRIIIQKIN